MELDDEVCLCFHVTKRKLLNFIRIERPRRVAQISDCFGAGTGCGWCRNYLKRLFDQHAESPSAAPPAGVSLAADADLTADEYAAARTDYVRRGGGTPPPGATPIGDAD
ncbi:MAG: (2Fe-2S)-binding protein [Pirellulales bacterium]